MGGPARTKLDASYIEDRSIPEPNSGCWLWLGPEANYGYGTINLRGRRMTAQRGSYLVFKGPVPDGHDVDHLCRNPACVNPAHLEAVTHQENCRRRNAVLTHCKNGHPFDYIDSRGSRRCHVCDAAAARRHYARAILAKLDV